MRRKKKEKRIISPDPVYNNVTVAKFINQIMRLKLLLMIMKLLQSIVINGQKKKKK